MNGDKMVIRNVTVVSERNDSGPFLTSLQAGERYQYRDGSIL